jgi:cyclopropane fatty-acyl-phospholipid synthase-like methyltransferase
MDRIEAIRAHYEHRICPRRENYEVLDWASAASQRLRFEVLAAHVPLAGRTLLDVGCGLGDLWAFLLDKGLDVDYTGVDVLAKMIAACGERFGPERFVRADVFAEAAPEIGPFDVVFASGIFNLNLGNNVEFLAAALRRLLTLAGETLALNLLDVRSPYQEDDYFFYDRSDVFAILQDRPCEVRVIDGYLPNDFTVICRKTARQQ